MKKVKNAALMGGGAVVGSGMAEYGLAWGMSEVSGETNEVHVAEPLETVQYETEAGRVTLEDADQNGVYDAVIINPTVPRPPATNGQIATAAAEVDAAEVAEGITDNMSFEEAFATARDEVGGGGIFLWQGNLYGTHYKEEWDAMTPAERDDYWASVHRAEQEDDYLLAQQEADSEGEEYVGDVIDDDGNSQELDLNEDGIIDAVAQDTDGDGQADQIYVDTDQDGKIDAVAADMDGDGKIDVIAQDTDGDGEMDIADVDTDGDGETDQQINLNEEDGAIDESEDYDGYSDDEQGDLDPNEEFGDDYDNNAYVGDMI